MFEDIYGRFALISAQDEQTAAHIRALGATVRVDGSLKPLAPALQVDQGNLMHVAVKLVNAPFYACFLSS